MKKCSKSNNILNNLNKNKKTTFRLLIQPLNLKRSDGKILVVDFATVVNLNSTKSFVYSLQLQPWPQKFAHLHVNDVYIHSL